MMNMMVKPEKTPFVEVELGGEKQLGVNARDLYEWLESKQDFSRWIKRRIEKYGFVEGRDYLTFQVVAQVPHQGGIRNVALTEYTLTVDMAKELSMVECTTRGREVRLYYIEQERIARNQKQDIQVEIGRIMQGIEQITGSLSSAASFLCIGGKQTKPRLLKELDDLIQQAQPCLNFDETR